MEYKHHTPSLDELRKTRKEVRHAHDEVRFKFSPLEKFAITVTRAVGTIGFFFALSVWTVGWLLWNMLAPLPLRFDPAPAFVIWLISSNIIQLVLLPLIMVGQNLEGKFAEQRAQEDFEINKKAEREIEVILAHLENQEEIFLHLARKLDK